MTTKVTLGTAALAVASWAGVISIASAADKPPTRPNVVLIISDDMGYADVPGFGADKEIPMPNLDRLRNGGVAFTNAYVTGPICVPSRMSIATGRHQARWGVYNLLYHVPNYRPTFELFHQEKFMPEYFKEAGYATALFGKWHLSGNDHEPAKLAAQPLPVRPEGRGFDEVCIIAGGMAWYWTTTSLYNTGGVESKTPKYLTDHFGDLAADFIKRKKDGPFFLNLGFNAVHAPLHALEEDIEASGGLAGYDRTRYVGSGDGENRDEKMDRRVYAGMMRALDRNVGKVLDALKKAGVEDNTLVAFINDNGGPSVYANPRTWGQMLSYNQACNDPLRGNKYDCLEGGIRVPMLMRWPARIPAGRGVSGVTSSMDILATFIAAAGLATPPRSLDGVDLLPFVTGAKTGDPHAALFWQNLHGNQDHPHQHAMRKGKWKLYQATMGNTMPVEGKWQLFDLSADPGERNDLSGVHPEIVRQLAAEWKAWRGQMITPSAAPRAEAVDLRCESVRNPAGVDKAKPVLSWALRAVDPAARGLRQTAYQVLVASSEGKLALNNADLWDSRRVIGDNMQVVYGGKPLPPDSSCHWKVKVWSTLNETEGHQDGTEASFSEPARFDTGLLAAQDWKGAGWIAWRPEVAWRQAWDKRIEKEFGAPKGSKDGNPFQTQSALKIFDLWRFHETPYDPAPLLRKEFKLDRPVGRARAYISGLGYHELFLNGKRVGNHLIDPAWTQYNRHTPYVVHDVTAQVQRGDNAIGVMLGRGYYGLPSNVAMDFRLAPYLGQPRLLFRLSVEYADGTRTDVVSGSGWKVTGGPVVFDCPRRGEIYDGRRELPGWDKPGYDDASWEPAVAAPTPAGQLVAEIMPPVRAMAEIHPISVSNPLPGVAVFDLGTNIAGWPRLKVSGPAGREILVEYTEIKPDEEKLMPFESFHQNWQQHGFILRGEGIETLEPRFCYSGFRYVVVSGAPRRLSVNDLVALHVHTDLASVGEFSCSNDIINRTHEAIRLTQLNNVHGIPQDCPHREKTGWGLDGVMSAEMAIYNFDMAAFYRKWIRDLWDGTDSRGRPFFFGPSHQKPSGLHPLLTSAALEMPWYLYLYYGDKGVLEEYYERMKHFVAESALGQVSPKEPHIVDTACGDWLAPAEGQPRVNLTKIPQVSKEGTMIYGTAFYYSFVRRMESVARVLGKSADVEGFAKLGLEIQAAFDRKFYDPQAGCYRGEIREITEYRQSANAIPLYFDLVPAERRPAIIQGLLADLARRNNRLNTGTPGTKALMEVLPAVGAGDVAFRVASQTALPGWGYMILNGAQTIWEGWGNKGVGSQDHPCLGSVGSYFYRHLAGIQPDLERPGFKHIIFRPTVVADLGSARATYNSRFGPITSDWKSEGGKLLWNVTVPANSTATAYIPATDAGGVTESGQPLTKARGVKFTKMENGRAVCELQSGRYRFTSEVK